MAKSPDAPPPAAPDAADAPPGDAAAPAAAGPPARSPSTRVPDKPKRRRFTSKHKISVVEAFLACKTPEDRGALIRKEGLYYGQVTDWVDAYRRGGLGALEGQRTGPKPAPTTVDASRLAEVERELAVWKSRAERAEALCEVQKKLSSLLGLLSCPSSDK